MYSRARGVSRASAKWRSAEALLDWKEWGSICEWVAPANWVAALAVSVRNPDIRRVELAWGSAITAEWAHFVAFGVFAYEQGGASAVGIAGLVRLLPAAIVAPFAASFGDRFRRERFLLTMSLVGSLALGASAAAAYADAVVLVFAFAALFGLACTLIGPRCRPCCRRSPELLRSSLHRTPRPRRSRAWERSSDR